MNLKDIFTPITLNEGVEPLNQSETITPVEVKNRMTQLIESFENKNEIIKEKIEKQDNTDKLQQEAERFNKLSKHRLNEYGNDSVREYGMKYGGGYGHTVSTMPDNEFCVKKFSDVNKANLTDSEALELSIKRVLKSGTPIENIGFYDEINFQLNGLGFQSKLPNDIKVALLQIMQQGVIVKDNIS